METARVINAINPDFIRLSTLHVVPGTELEDLVKSGEFQPLGDEDILREIQLFIENLEVKECHLVSDHILNLAGRTGRYDFLKINIKFYRQSKDILICPMKND